MLFKLSRYQNLFQPKILERGNSYYQGDSVSQLSRQQGDDWTARVAGEQDNYQVQLTLSALPDGDVLVHKMRCSCPYADNCKHMVAVLMVLKQLDSQVFKTNFSPQNVNVLNASLATLSESKQTFDQQQNAFNQQLKQFTASELSDFIQHLANKQSNIIQEWTFWANQQRTTTNEQQSTEITNKFPTDSQVIRSIHQRIDEILTVDDDYEGYFSDYGEFVFDEQCDGLEKLIKEFESQPYYQLEVAIYWIEQIISHFDDIGDVDIDTSLCTAYQVLGEVLFGDDDYQPDWHTPFIAYQSTAEQAIIDKLAVNINDWCNHSTYYDGKDVNVRRLQFDFYLATAQGDKAMAWLDTCIRKLSSREYGLSLVLQLKVAYLQHLGDSEQVANLLNDYLYLKDIRKVRLEQLLATDNVKDAIALIEEGIKVAEEKSHLGTVNQWKKQLSEVAKKYDLTAIVRKNSDELAFDSHQIDTIYFAQWKATFDDKQWLQIRTDRQLKLRQLAQQSYQQEKNQTKNRWSVPFSRADKSMEQLCQFYDLEGQHDELRTLIQSHAYDDIVEQYLPILAKSEDKACIDWLIKRYAQRWEKHIIELSSRKQYNQLASDISQTVHRMPQGKSAWQQLVATWQQRYSSQPRKPALLDELGKISWG